MPITRRRRATSPEQPENNHNHSTEQVEMAAADTPAGGPSGNPNASDTPSEGAPTPQRGENPPERYTPYMPSSPLQVNEEHPENGERTARHPRGERTERSDYSPSIEGGRRTARGEFFRRPPQPPAQPVPSVVPSMPIQPPSHEINLPLGNLLHLAYNPSYTGSEEARSTLLQKLANESKSGGRARCWNCGSLAIVYDRWSTRSKTFGEVGIAFCEICGVWSVL
jgi:hypothetical protein